MLGVALIPASHRKPTPSAHASGPRGCRQQSPRPHRARVADQGTLETPRCVSVRDPCRGLGVLIDDPSFDADLFPSPAVGGQRFDHDEGEQDRRQRRQRIDEVAEPQAIISGLTSPRLLEVNCRTIPQMRLANALCRLVELGADDASRS